MIVFEVIALLRGGSRRPWEVLTRSDRPHPPGSEFAAIMDQLYSAPVFDVGVEAAAAAAKDANVQGERVDLRVGEAEMTCPEESTTTRIGPCSPVKAAGAVDPVRLLDRPAEVFGPHPPIADVSRPAASYP